MISMTSVPIDTSCVAIKHQSTIARFGDSWDKTGIGITPDPFGRGAYNLQSISATRKKVVWFTRLGAQAGFAKVLAARVGAQAGFATVLGLAFV